MARRLIGVDIDEHFVRTALLEEEKGGTRLLGVHRFPRPADGDPAALLHQAIGTTRLGDRIAASLPASAAFSRRLRFPFAEEKKIAAALPMEMALQLPISVEDCTLVFQKPQAEAAGFRVTAAAVRSEAIAGALTPFDDQQIPLNVLGLAPFTLTHGLKSDLPNALLVAVAPRETCLALVVDGDMLDHRLLMTPDDIDESLLAAEILRAGTALRRSHGKEHFSIQLVGSGATAELQERLRAAGETAAIPRIELEGQPLAAEFLPALALARRAGLSDRERAFNLRIGPFALKSEWGRMKKRLLGMAALLTLSLALLAASAYLGYSRKADEAARLQQEMNRIYRETFPGTQTIVDAPLQMRAQLKELQKIGRMVGTGDAASALTILTEFSRNTPADLRIDIRDFSYTPEAVRLEGVTSSFDAINRLSRTLQQSPLFQEARIDDAKMSLDGNQVDFRLSLPLRKEP